MKRTLSIFLLFAILLILALPITAHPGDTDANGGHYDNSTGEYHYHHGYPAHQHKNGNCPYDYDDRTGQNSGSSSSKSNSSTSSTIRKDVLFAVIAIPVSWLIFLSPIIYVSCVDKVESFFDHIRRIFRRKQSPSDSSESKEKKQDSITPPNFKPPNPPDDFPPTPITNPKASVSTPHTTLQKSQVVNTSTPTSLSTPTIPPSPPQEPPVSNPRPRKEHSSGSTNTPPSIHHESEKQSSSPFVEQKLSTPTPSTIPHHRQQPPTPRKSLRDYPEILDYDADFLTERQAIIYAESIKSPRGRRALTEYFHFDPPIIDKTQQPFRVEGGVFSAHSLHYYETTLNSCTCPDHQTRHVICKHMIALAIEIEALTIDKDQIINNSR